MTQTINLAPDNDGLIQWLRQMTKDGDGAQAAAIFAAGWPDVALQDIERVLAGAMSLADAVRVNGPNWREEHQP
jgi:hypothetical protein